MVSLAIMDEFYVTVSSQNTDTFPDNVCYDFQVDLGQEHRVPNGEEWEVGVTHFSYPFAWSTIDTNEPPSIRIKHTLNHQHVTRRNTGDSITCTLPNGCYTSASGLINAMKSVIHMGQNNEQEWLNFGEMFIIEELSGTGRCALSLSTGDKLKFHSWKEGLILQYNDTFADTFGFDTLGGEGQETVVVSVYEKLFAKKAISFHRNVRKISIVSNIVEHETTCKGTVSPTLLSSTDVVRPIGGHITQHIRPSVVEYKRITASDLRHLHFKIIDQNGEIINFSETLGLSLDPMKSHIWDVLIGLHFRRRKKRDTSTA